MKNISALIIILFCIFSNVNGQDIKSLKIGDTIPEAIWNMPLRVINHPQGKKTITLNEYRNKKLIILDFWATWCSPCIASLDKSIPIYNKHKHEMMLLPIDSHQEKSIQLAENLMKSKKWNIPSVNDIDQFLFTKVFPPISGSGIPHMVWIRDGKVLSIPKTEYATEDNIVKAIKGEKLDIVMDTIEHDSLDYRKPLFVNNNGATGVYFKNPPYSVIARYLPGYGTGRKTVFLKVGDTAILAAVNRPLQQLLFDAYRPMLFSNLDVNNGIVWNISDSLNNRIFHGPKYDKSYNLAHEISRNQWLAKNTYGYNLRYPESIREKEAYYFMQQDISRFFGIYLHLKFSVESAKKHKYAILRLKGTRQQSIDLLIHKGTKTGMEKSDGVSFYKDVAYKQSFLAKLNKAVPGLTIKSIIDSTGISPDLKVDFQFPMAMPTDYEQINRELKRYGLELFVEEKFVPVLVVREENTTHN